ncbi:WXG100 family type VII secretion target [Amycolatopsis sp. WAC 04169]|uniref:WXG100 family type VII secretion target n=1 Tax=Amycolatopsis sp. WAC 04169 TaxID=2203197 RepID=UPI001F45091D|nr:WXG100 family type VII secretion target [Amycolatopsis sp. WAC 04169]
MSVPIGAPPEYPHAADAKIREFANLPFIGRPDILHLLDDVRDRLLGNPVRIQEMALQFANNKTIHDARSDFESATQSLAGTWTGRAADQFSAYASRVTSALEKEQEAVGTLSGLLVGVAQVVIDTYAKAIEFLGVCAGRLATIDIKMLLAAAASVVPGLNAIVWSDVIDTIVEAFGTLVENFLALLGAAVEQTGKFYGAAVGFQQIATNFFEVPDMSPSSGMDDQKQWKIEPDAVPE